MIKITIDTDGAAFEENPDIELAAILKTLAYKLEHSCHIPHTLIDKNGNTCGTVEHPTN